MILVIIKEPLSYFRPYKTYFLAIYSFFNAFPISQLVLIFYPNEDLIRLTTQSFAAAAAIIATLWGLLVTKLYFYPEKFSLRSALANPRKPIHLAFLLYLVPMVFLVILTIVDAPSIDPRANRQAFYVLDNTTYRAVGLGSFLLTIAAIVISSFTLYSFVVLSRLRSQLRDREVRGALRVIARCFAAVSALLLFGYASASFGYSLLGVVHFACVILLLAAVTAFKRPTFLRAFLGLVPSLGPNPGVMRGDQIVLIYEKNEAKMTPIARFVNEGVNQQDRVLYFHSNDEGAARDELSRNGVDVKHNLTKGNLRLPSLDSLYQGENLLDEEAAIAQCQELAIETRALGKNGLRIVIDYGDRIKRPLQKFVNHIADPRWATPDHYAQVMMTFVESAFENEQSTLSLLKSKLPVIDLTESSDVFSRTVGLSHDEIAGRKILLEYDPLSGYEKILKSLATEAASNFERVILFTRKDSPIHSTMEDEPGLKMFVLTSRVSYPKEESENVVLIPAFDSSLILDSMNKTIEAYASTPFTMIFDNVSHQIFTLGTERAHSFVRQALELMASNRITGVFLLNYPAHDMKAVSMFENLFDLELISRQGTRIPEVRRKLTLSA
ncbi:MAG TPA: MEDS domain-containing protein [Candidatus Bathyarchaeia archaeon]|nr:MEDS domain-containing protein [Candidatus Bathyarchaeia archaeon]